MSETPLELALADLQGGNSQPGKGIWAAGGDLWSLKPEGHPSFPGPRESA